ncbi:methyltransferase family protein [Bradyrhizobium canariense]|uniref:Protein-S-isoprenylcysteine O-methyltransferase Ste14 n=1 Tax=Bradyrhizobium canariense TaxID=255045 RepID=A0A1H1UHW5_9BRAD|nr:isoprenylcysteine carboxylmethyltransferase family protein [Bradyrhizobium canariense]SDS72144.1 Protein-S-isoprenylcysteine O-methyltransferase Ste14 [Bradyrhizobium canariense]
MPSRPGEIYDAVLSGWIVTWPTKLLALIWLAWVVSWIVASVWSGRTKTYVPTLDSWVYRLPILLGAILLSPWTAGALGEKALYDLGNAGTYVLAVVVLIGISFTWWARIHLGRYWSNAITHKEDHRIIDTGPYGMVRHPIYTGLILAILATGVAVGTWTSLIGALLISFGEWQKARMEEGFLTAELGAEIYGPYCRRVPMIVPFLRF